MNSTTINLESLLDLSAKLNESNSVEYILNAALLSLMGKLRIMRTAALIPVKDRLQVLVSKGKLQNAEYNKINCATLFEVTEENPDLLSDGFVTCAPICSRGELRAVLCLGNNITKTPLDDTEKQYVTLVCTIIANALQTAEFVHHLIQEKASVEARNQLLQTMFDMSLELSSTFTKEQILQTFSFRLMGQLMVSKFALALKRPDGSMELLANRFPVTFTDEQLELLQLLRKTIFTNSIELPERIRGVIKEQNIAVLTPLTVKGEVRGVLAIGKKLHGEFTETETKFVESLGSTVVTALENSRLFQEELEKKKLESELDIAKQIQRKLLPDVLPTLPGFDIAGMNISSKQVGGDYYDVIPLPNNVAHVAIADVSGKGMPASLLMANVQAALRVLVPLQLHLPDMIARLNDIVYTNTSADKFVTFFGAHVHATERKIEFTNAGHNPPLLCKTNGDIIELCDGGLILGVMESMIPYKQGCVVMEKGDVLLMFTDGVNEAMDEDNKEFGDGRLKGVLCDHAHLSSNEILNVIVRDIKQHAGKAPQSDDITLLVIKAVE